MHSVAPYGADGLGAQTEPAWQSSCTTAVVEEQACAVVAQEVGVMDFDACGVQLASSTTGADAEMAEVCGVPQPVASLTVLQTPGARAVVEQADVRHKEAVWE